MINKFFSASDKTVSCKKCGNSFTSDELRKNLFICPSCKAYLRINSRERIALICDKLSFKEHDKKMTSSDPLSFPDYGAKLEKAAQISGCVRHGKNRRSANGGFRHEFGIYDGKHGRRCRRKNNAVI